MHCSLPASVSLSRGRVPLALVFESETYILCVRGLGSSGGGLVGEKNDVSDVCREDRVSGTLGREGSSGLRVSSSWTISVT